MKIFSTKEGAQNNGKHSYDFIPSLQYSDRVLLHRSPVLGSGRHPDGDQPTSSAESVRKKAATKDDEYHIKRMEFLK